MEWAVLVILLVLAIPIVGLWLVFRAVETSKRFDELTQRLSILETELQRLKGRAVENPPAAAAPEPAPAPAPVLSTPTPHAPAPTVPEQTAPAPTPAIPIIEPVPPRAVPPPLPVAATVARPSSEKAPPPLAVHRVPTINWEQFMGVKMFAWIGGFALFLGVIFFVKYSFEHNWISPELRVTVGFLTGIGLLIGGMRLSRKEYPTLSQTLCATGIVILYAVTFAARSIYQFPFFSIVPTFLIMGLITAVAFVLAVRFNALVIGILGMLGGFLTPILVHTGQDNPLGLFGYIAILDLGLLAVASRRRWDFLPALAAAGTVLTQIGWAAEFFLSNNYAASNRILIPMGVSLGFTLLYLAAAWQAVRAGHRTWWLAGSVLGLAAAAFGFALWFLDFATLATRPALIFGFVLLVDLAVSILRWFDERCAPADSLAGLAAFLLLAVWTNYSLEPALLNTGLVLFLLFGLLHTALPVLRRLRVEGRRAGGWEDGLTKLFAPLALLLILVPIFRFSELSFVVWPAVFLVDLLAIGLAIMTAALLPVLAALILTLVATAGLLLKLNSSLEGLFTFLTLLGLFSAFFFGIGLWLIQRLSPDSFKRANHFGDDTTRDLTLAIPMGSALLPFTLLIMATVRLTLPDPTPVFALGFVLVLMLLGLSLLLPVPPGEAWREGPLGGMPAIALACIAALECAWHLNHFIPTNPTVPLAWYLIFLGVFAIFPLAFVRRLSERVVPWAVAACAGVPQFFLVHDLVRKAYPNEAMGLLPAAFALAPGLGLLLTLKRSIQSPQARLAQLAWFGGVTLLFVTLICPIQFKRQWLTLGWALEGAALLWLYLRVPHPGLRWTGLGLLLTAFFRLTLNLATLEYHRRSEIPVFNWYLYTYGIVTLCLFAGAWLARPDSKRPMPFKPRGLLVSLGTILAFWLLNLEIFDAFTPPGHFIEVEFSGNFTCDMTFSIAWALFALMLMIVGIACRQRAFRYAGVALLCVTLLKLFFHDLAQLEQLYRIGAFVAVAVIAILASFAYQKFFSAALKRSETSEP